jgi:hypothetical protein
MAINATPIDIAFDRLFFFFQESYIASKEMFDSK